MMNIRPYRPEDREQAVILFEAFQDYLIALDPLDRMCRLPGYGEQYVTRTIRDTSKEGTFQVAEQSGVLVGLVAGYIKRQKTDDLLDHVPSVTGWVTELYVSPEARGSGVGKKLLVAAEDFFRSSGCDVSRLVVFVPNNFARRFYDGQGYSERDIELIKAL